MKNIHKAITNALFNMQGIYDTYSMNDDDGTPVIYLSEAMAVILDLENELLNENNNTNNNPGNA